MQVLQKASDATGIPIKKLLNYAMIASVVLVMLGVGQTYITQVIGVAYPCFMSFLALESDGADDDKQWLTYWVCFGAFNILDQFAGIILSFIPFYYFLKMGFLVYLMHPSTLGATVVFNTYILPLMKENEARIKQMEDLAQQKFNEAHSKANEMVSGKKDE